MAASTPTCPPSEDPAAELTPESPAYFAQFSPPRPHGQGDEPCRVSVGRVVCLGERRSAVVVAEGPAESLDRILGQLRVSDPHPVLDLPSNGDEVVCAPLISVEPRFLA